MKTKHLFAISNTCLYKYADTFVIISLQPINRLPRMKGEKLMNYTIETKEENIKAQYIEAIIKLLNKCNDISLLDLIHKLLKKSV